MADTTVKDREFPATENGEAAVVARPRVDILETEQELVLLADLPGVKPADVDVRFENGELTAVVRDTGSWRDKRGEHRGRGLSIIEDLMDDVAVERADGGTLVRMRKRVLGEDRAA